MYQEETDKTGRLTVWHICLWQGVSTWKTVNSLPTSLGTSTMSNLKESFIQYILVYTFAPVLFFHAQKYFLDSTLDDIFLYTWHLLHFCPSWERDPSHVALSEGSTFFLNCYCLLGWTESSIPILNIYQEAMCASGCTWSVHSVAMSSGKLWRLWIKQLHFSDVEDGLTLSGQVV